MVMKKGRRRAGKRVSKRKAGARRRVIVNKALQPIAQRYICKMKYCEAFNLDTTGSVPGAVVQRMRLNSIYDPNLTGTGHKPYGFDQLLGFPNATPPTQGLYNRYRVISCSYNIFASPGAGQNIQITALPANESVSTVSGLNGSALREQPRARYISQTTGAPLKLLKGKVYLPSLVGRTKSQYMADDRYQAMYNENPLEAAILNIYLNELSDSSGIITPVQCKLNVELTYTVELFDVVNKSQSSVSP